ncbi:UDP-galactose transporter [Malassezia psittaci]|uniref:UDP-galactose transporter homolog 1 n=1 Tax=Malassezia psittaci TaxID=1821823 RepID=A0AAF0FCV0_9BASI|nr:UDP-galactose transporter [Malassezia psittaci]
MAKQNGVVQLAMCAAMIYCMFLVWGILQEKITSTVYTTGRDIHDPLGEHERFEYGVLLNAVQALFSCLAVSVYLLVTNSRGTGSKQSLMSRLGLEVLTPKGCQQALVARGKESSVAHEPRGVNRFLSPLLQQYLMISAMQSTGSWLSIVSLRFLSFPAITLAKSSKLVPVLLMNVLLYRRKFAPYKYAVVFLVTLGVYMFMALGKAGAKKQGPGGSRGHIGLILLAVHLLLDGTINSTQDNVFATYGTDLVTGTQMMLVMNAISASYMSLALLLPEGLAQLLHPHWIAAVLVGDSWARPMAPSYTPQLVAGAQFLLRHPDAALDVAMYAMAGAAGQIAIFETLERFGSLTLVSITVTRKLFTMLLSIMVYKHHLQSMQWVGIAIVFGGLFLEVREKQRQSAAARAARASKIQ